MAQFLPRMQCVQLLLLFLSAVLMEASLLVSGVQAHIRAAINCPRLHMAGLVDCRLSACSATPGQ
jgi:hypothetical protein